MVGEQESWGVSPEGIARFSTLFKTINRNFAYDFNLYYSVSAVILRNSQRNVFYDLRLVGHIFPEISRKGGGNLSSLSHSIKSSLHTRYTCKYVRVMVDVVNSFANFVNSYYQISHENYTRKIVIIVYEDLFLKKSFDWDLICFNSLINRYY